MRTGTVTAAAAIASTPTLVLLAMLLSGNASPVPAMLGIITIVGASLLIALFWSRELDILAMSVHQAVSQNGRSTGSSDRLSPRIGAIVRDVEKLARMTAAQAAQVEQLRRADAAIVEHLPDPLIILGAEREVRRANAAARAAFGNDMSAVLRHPGLRAAIDRAYAQGTRQQAELLLPVPVTRELHATVILMDPPLSDGGKGVVVLSDRTRERTVERTRADFVANASHELRTPLASLIGFIDTLAGPAADDPPAQQRFLSIMAEQAARMNRLIDDLLSLSRIELTEHQPPSETVDLGLLMTRMTAGFEPRLAPRGLRMVVNVPADLARVRGGHGPACAGAAEPARQRS